MPDDEGRQQRAGQGFAKGSGHRLVVFATRTRRKNLSFGAPPPRLPAFAIHATSISPSALKTRILILLLALGVGLLGGWFMPPTWLWQKPALDTGSSTAPRQMLASQLLIDSHCSTPDLASEWRWLEKHLVPELLETNAITAQAAGKYKLAAPLDINGDGDSRLLVNAFGSVEQAEYFEIYYLTTRRYPAMVGLFKGTPEKGSHFAQVIRRSLTPAGLRDELVLHIEKTTEGTRVACRAMKGKEA